MRVESGEYVEELCNHVLYVCTYSATVHTYCTLYCVLYCTYMYVPRTSEESESRRTEPEIIIVCTLLNGQHPHRKSFTYVTNFVIPKYYKKLFIQANTKISMFKEENLESNVVGNYETTSL